MIKIHNLYAGYNGVEVLNGISLEINEGEFAGIVGPNGSGKTTLLRCLSRTLTPESGTIYINNKESRTIPLKEFAKKVAVVPQDTYVAFDFTVQEVVLMGRSPHLGRLAIESKKDLEIANNALNLTGTAHLAERSIKALSGGERQRVMIARALAQEPDILLLDEPTSHLDISYQFEIMDLIKNLNLERGLTVIAVLHDLNLAGEYCDIIAIIGEGTVKFIGIPEEVITSENIRQVYKAEVWVRKHPTTSRPYIISGINRGSKKLSNEFSSTLRIHVVGGGGTAAPILAKLSKRGYFVSCGVLNIADADQEVAEALDIPHITEPLFSEISPESHKKHMELIESAEVVVLTDVPFGFGNILNLEAVLGAARSGKVVIIFKPESFNERDFTDGNAFSIYQEIINTGAIPVHNADDLLTLLNERQIKN